MADTGTISEAINATINNASEAKNATMTGREAATPHGLLIAYCSLVLMALLPIFFGAFRSVGHKKRQAVEITISFQSSLILDSDERKN